MENRNQFRTPAQKRADKHDLYKSELDKERPYRIVAPTHSLEVCRLSTEKEARKYFNAVSNQGHQCILSFIDTSLMTIKVLAYSACKIYNNRR